MLNSTSRIACWALSSLFHPRRFFNSRVTCRRHVSMCDTGLEPKRQKLMKACLSRDSRCTQYRQHARHSRCLLYRSTPKPTRRSKAQLVTGSSACFLKSCHKLERVRPYLPRVLKRRQGDLFPTKQFRTSESSISSKC